MPNPAIIVRVAASLSYLVMVHVAALLDEPLIGVASIVLLLLCCTIASVVSKGLRPSTIPWLIGCATFLVLLIAGLRGSHAVASVILFPPALISAYFLALFGRTLMPGQVPLITRFSRVNFDGAVPPSIADYTRRLTAIWTCMFGLMTVETAMLGAFADLRTWSWWANVINPAVAVSFFLLEHIFRAVRYHDWGHSSPLRTIAIMLRPSSWMEADVKWSSRR